MFAVLVWHGGSLVCLMYTGLEVVPQQAAVLFGLSELLCCVSLLPPQKLEMASFQ